MTYECISMDGFKTEANEHGLAIVDRHTGHVWCEKTGKTETGTARVIFAIILRQNNLSPLDKIN